MSHYCVGVITKNRPTEEIIAEIMNPFYEGIEVKPYICETPAQYLEKKRRELEDYKTSGPYAQWASDPEKYEEDCSNPAHIEYLRNFMTIYNSTDEQLLEERKQFYPAEEGEGCEWIDGDGNVWTTYNPISKWDWYVIGGRWNDCIPLKCGAGTNAAQVKDIDWGVDIDFDKERIVYQDEYNRLINNGDILYNAKYYSDNFPTIEDYIRDKKQFITFAIIDVDKKWIEKGRMGWFGISSETPQESIVWNKSFYDTFIKDLDQEWYFTIVDCHI